jgi:hypothetical protein
LWIVLYLHELFRFVLFCKLIDKYKVQYNTYCTAIYCIYIYIGLLVQHKVDYMVEIIIVPAVGKSVATMADMMYLQTMHM